jgi:hypothetical protein
MDTFVLRIWAPASGASEIAGLPVGIHGTAHHVTSGRSGVFRSEEQLVRLLAELRREALADGATTTGETQDGPVAA